MRRALLVVLCLSAASPAFAWGKLGHRAIAIMAERRLNPRARRALRELLGPRAALADVSTCADDIKRKAIKCAGFPVNADRRTSGWHFINIPLGATPVKGRLAQYCRNHGRQDDCAPMALKAQLKVLRDPAAGRYEKQLALMYVVHLVGDEHQPLHASDAGDAGGNRVLVRFMQTPRQRRPANLHHVWDNVLYADSTVKKRGAQEFADELERDMSGRDTRSWTGDDLVELPALEAFNIAKFKIYPALEREGADLGKDYQREMQPLAFEQLEKAGVRLGQLLNESLAPGEG